MVPRPSESSSDVMLMPAACVEKNGLILQVELDSFHFEEGQLKKFTAGPASDSASFT